MLSDDAGLYKRIEKLENQNQSLTETLKAVREELDRTREQLVHWRNLYGKQR